MSDGCYDCGRAVGCGEGQGASMSLRDRDRVTPTGGAVWSTGGESLLVRVEMQTPWDVAAWGWEVFDPQSVSASLRLRTWHPNDDGRGYAVAGVGFAEALRPENRITMAGILMQGDRSLYRFWAVGAFTRTFDVTDMTPIMVEPLGAVDLTVNREGRFGYAAEMNNDEMTWSAHVVPNYAFVAAAAVDGSAIAEFVKLGEVADA